MQSVLLFQAFGRVQSCPICLANQSSVLFLLDGQHPTIPAYGGRDTHRDGKHREDLTSVFLRAWILSRFARLDTVDPHDPGATVSLSLDSVSGPSALAAERRARLFAKMSPATKVTMRLMKLGRA